MTHLQMLHMCIYAHVIGTTVWCLTPVGAAPGPMSSQDVPTGAQIPTVTALAKGMMLLTCEMSNVTSDVIWQRLRDNVVVSRGVEVTKTVRNRMRVVPSANPITGQTQFNLLIKFVKFPDDNSDWSCQSSGKDDQITKLIVLSPPPSNNPTVIPGNLSQIDLASDAWAFTCVSHFAFPPVNLTWVKVQGPLMEYDITPPRFMVAPSSQAMSVSVKLILTPANFGSVFACIAQHPTFMNQVYNTTLYFTPPMAQPLTMKELKQRMVPPSIKLGGQFGTIDTVVVYTVVGLVCVFFLVGACLLNKRRYWQLDVRLPYGYAPVPTSDIPNGGSHKILRSDGKSGLPSVYKRMRQRCVCKVVITAVLITLLLLSVSVAVPIYFKGMIVPDMGTDETVIAMAGSALWLDCSHLTVPLSSLLVVTWRQNVQPFYKQLLVQGQTMGIALNATTPGRVLGSRVTSQGIGQVSIRPMMPGESGLYSCDVTMIQDDTGRSIIRRKFYGVYVGTGPVFNWALLALLAVALICSAGLAILSLVHCIRRKNTKQKA